MMAVWVILFTKKIEEKKVNTSSKKKKEGKF